MNALLASGFKKFKPAVMLRHIFDHLTCSKEAVTTKLAVKAWQNKLLFKNFLGAMRLLF